MTSSDTPHRLKPDGCSLQHARWSHRSTMGLPSPQDIPGRVLVAVQHQPAGGTDMRAHAEALRDARPTPATVLAGRGRFHQHHALAGPCCLAGEDGAELRPVRITDALGMFLAGWRIRTRLATRRSLRHSMGTCGRWRTVVLPIRKQECCYQNLHQFPCRARRGARTTLRGLARPRQPPVPDQLGPKVPGERGRARCGLSPHETLDRGSR